VNVPVRRALLSVSDKTGLVELATHLVHHRIEILSTGGTAEILASGGIPVIDVSSYTGFPEIMGGRVKTLHPKIHGGLLGRRGIDEEVMAAHAIAPIDLLVVNLYPFAQSIARAGSTPAEAIENIDIGGPAMLRAAAKNHAAVAVVVDPADYAALLDELEREGGATRLKTRARLAAKAFAHSASYDTLIAHYLLGREPRADAAFPDVLPLVFTRVQALRYGENPQQQAALYREPASGGSAIATARVLQGKDPSYNNIADADAAIQCVRQFEKPACVIVKHANPCGAATRTTLLAAYEEAYRTDPVSAYGGIIAVNQELDAASAQAIIARQFVEVLVAPGVSDAAQKILNTKPNIRVLEFGELAHGRESALEYRSVSGGLLVQSIDSGAVSASDLELVTKRAPSDSEIVDLIFAWRICKFVKSNAIVFARHEATIGIGAGQMSRIHSTRIAAIKAADAKLAVAGAALASDAFFPFADGLVEAANVGIRAVIQPGGSMRDREVIAAADAHGIAMVFTRMRHFRH